MPDPLSDPRAASLLSADPNEISFLAGMLRRVSDQAGTSAAGLRAAAGDLTWTGDSANRLRSRLGKLPMNLDQISVSHEDAATALDAYSASLEPIQSQFSTLQDQLSDARWRLDVALVHHPGGHLGLREEVWRLEGRGYRLLDEFDEVRAVARARVSAAGSPAPPHQGRGLGRGDGAASTTPTDLPVVAPALLAAQPPPALAPADGESVPDPGAPRTGPQRPLHVKHHKQSSIHSGRKPRRKPATHHKRKPARHKRSGTPSRGGFEIVTVGAGIIAVTRLSGNGGTETVTIGPSVPKPAGGSGSGSATTTIGPGGTSVTTTSGSGSGTETVTIGPGGTSAAKGSGSGTTTIGGSGSGSGTTTIGGSGSGSGTTTIGGTGSGSGHGDSGSSHSGSGTTTIGGSSGSGTTTIGGSGHSGSGVTTIGGAPAHAANAAKARHAKAIDDPDGPDALAGG